MEELINLDENANLVTKASLVQDFRDTYSKCWLVFTFSEDLNFFAGYGFTCWGIQWEAVSYKKVLLNGSFVYSVMGYPQGICSKVDKKYVSLSALANGFNVAFDSRVSTDLEFEFPIHNVTLGSLLFKYRYSSIEENADDPAKAWFIFYDQRGLVGQTYSSLARSDVHDYDAGLLYSLGGSMSFIQDIQNANFVRHQLPCRVHYKTLISSFIGEKFDVAGKIPGVVGTRYKLVNDSSGLYTGYDKLILVKQKYDSTKTLTPWTLTFGQSLLG